MVNTNITITEEELSKIYKKISDAHTKYLKKHGVRLPKLRNNNDKLTKNAIVLCLLAKYEGQPISKAQITAMVRKWYPQTNDTQQARHLGMQSGWYILSGTRGDFDSGLKPNEYCLKTLKKSYPGFLGETGHRAARGGKDFEALKIKYDSRCATCGSKEGESNFLNSSVKTKLEEAHMNPNLPLNMENMIPQCQICNKAYRDWFVFDGLGRITDINYKSKRWQKKYKLIK